MKLTWILRTAEPQVALWAAAEASPLLRSAWSTVLGDIVPDAHWRLITLPIRAGGAGLIDPTDIVHAALISSWLSAATQLVPLACSCPPNGLSQVLAELAAVAPHLGNPLVTTLQLNGLTAVRQHQLLPQWCSQGSWTDEVIQHQTTTFDTSVQERLQSLRKLQLAPHAGLWLTAQPRCAPNAPSFAPEEWQLLLKKQDQPTMLQTGPRMHGLPPTNGCDGGSCPVLPEHWFVPAP